MGWFRQRKGRQWRSGSTKNEDSSKTELLALGIHLGPPGLVRSFSSQSSLDSFTENALQSLEVEALPEQGGSFLPVNGRLSSHLEEKGSDLECIEHAEQEKTASLLEVLGGIHLAVEAMERCSTSSKEEEEDMLEDRKRISGPGVANSNLRRRQTEPSLNVCPRPYLLRRRTICPATFDKTVARSREVSSTISSSQDTPWRGESMQTFPKTSFRASKFSKGMVQNFVRSDTCEIGEKSISFSPNVHVLEYERDVEQYAAPDSQWSKYFS